MKTESGHYAQAQAAAVSLTFSAEEYEGHDSCTGAYTIKHYRTPELQDQHSNSEMPNQILIFYIPRTEEKENEKIISSKNHTRDTNIWAPLPSVVLTRKYMLIGDKIWISLCQTKGNRNPIFIAWSFVSSKVKSFK